ncbi:hypothetical protein EG359_10390 [Chryseobacterium joostei]|nr:MULTISPECIES: hypothetical protein [Chryseobacterium]AZA77811.1 hypothetical protein EG347_09920 [Chryseobacterium sp. G0186]AZB00006.1 hypothetical protein EG359_10390 [Chryseobacterium joostei]
MKLLELVSYFRNGGSYEEFCQSNFFDFYYFPDTIEEANNEENQALNDEELTRLLFNYAINGA